MYGGSREWIGVEKLIFAIPGRKSNSFFPLNF
jgi:hypothetical protein